MIAYTCRHCGERMPVKEEEGNRKARCPKCQVEIVIPTGDSTTSLKRGRSRKKPLEGEPTVLTPRPPKPPGDTHAEKGINQEAPTRADGRLPGGQDVESILEPAQQPGEIGRLGGYRVLEVVGAGGMGVVFKGEDVLLRRVVALKAMLPGLATNATARERFLREARAAAAIQHDRVVAIYQVGEVRGVPFLAMPFLRGETLESRIKKVGLFPTVEIRRIAREICEGLTAIHERGLVHRDIKPANIWLEGPQGRVKILDFGLARLSQGEAQLTQEGAIVGSPAFMAPEQASKQPLDARADLFSLGCVLYLMCTGQLPFEGGDVLSTLMALASQTPAEPRSIQRGVPADLSELIMRLLAKKAEDRPESAREVAEMMGA